MPDRVYMLVTIPSKLSASRFMDKSTLRMFDKHISLKYK